MEKTLLEILLEELPKRGGWPEGATDARQDWDGEICFTGGCGVDHDFYVRVIAKDADRDKGVRIVTVSAREYEQAVK